MSNKRGDKAYWICIIGPADRKKLPNGSDGPMRKAVEGAFLKLTGHQEDLDESGWGADQEMKDVINAVVCMDKDNPLYQVIKNMLIFNKRIDG